MDIPSELGVFRIFPREILAIIISFCPRDCWNLNKYFRILSYAILPFEEKQRAFLHACSTCGYLELLNILLKDRGVNPGEKLNTAIRYASAEGRLEVVKRLLQDERVNPGDFGNEAIITASTFGHLEIVEILLRDERVDPSDRNNRALVRALQGGKLKIVQRLLSDERVKGKVNADFHVKYSHLF